MTKQLTFNEFRAANRERCLKWHPQGIESWSDSDWITAIVGELGELASLIKMRNRERDGLGGNKFSPANEQIAKEAADVLTYLDLFCERNGIDLGLWAALKFNEVSERVGFPDRIEPGAERTKILTVDHVGMSYGKGEKDFTVIVCKGADIDRLQRGTKLYL